MQVLVAHFNASASGPLLMQVPVTHFNASASDPL